jgi:DNA adenine methylase
MNPILKWAGGKRGLVSTLAALYTPYRDQPFVEPFAGGLAISLGLEPEQVIANDVNPHVINLYRQIQQGLSITIPIQNDRAVYDKYRTRFNDLIRYDCYQTKEAAQLFYYLNRTGFNGLCRFNSKGFYNVPFGKYSTITYAQNFDGYTAAMRDWTFSCVDFSQLVIPRGAFIYADPPYDTEFTSYSAGGFSWRDQERCAEWLAAHAGPVVVSNQATQRVLDLYRSLGFEIELITMPRRISCSGDRTPAQEMLATKNLAPMSMYQSIEQMSFV